ncbi:BON domain-containing protein [Rhodoferax antarcticus]|uniref:Osmotically-inducible protein Y n=1 Tax=Rhodoferax antarcticus ANT.BR TaxID=1111071 RepID=A0A1Q8Y9Z0_9BURK|nr:BON domain-containing protein [Rhodoferax antarcticus]APW47006.1 transporter [Rhodoferax antarcticus]MCW2311643.1 hyperosmotically inducible protein [Rhodoferax antarcticus]OLP04866.1 transport associated protein, osmotically inducible [Rhodoferax antarcticus ANT.BR]
MRNPLGLRILTTTLAGVMTISMVACSKAADTSTTGTPAPSTSVGNEIDDSVVTTRVKTALLDNMEVKGFDIQVETRKGEVLLSGFVDNQGQIDGAMTVAQGIEGVKGVSNKLSLKEGAATVGSQIDDSVITGKIKAALLADNTIKGLDITVTTNKGEAQLSGFVDNQGQIDRAVEVARGIEGVTQVGNEMSLKK